MGFLAVIDYDMGNLHSACKGLEKAGIQPKITNSPQDIAEAEAIVLPGVGSFDPAVQNLRSRNLEEPIKKAIAEGKPFLGICLGLQILFKSEPNLTIPHMGWNQLQLAQANLSLWQGLTPDPYVYFVHSYYVDPVDAEINAAVVTHGSQTVTAAIARDNLMAVQFHPEKSSDNGLQILSNFAAMLQKNLIN